MPGSANEGKEYAAQFIINNNIKTCLDVGPGWGTYSLLIKKYRYEIEQLDCVEIWAPYVEKYNLRDLYDNVYIDDIRKWNNFNYDLIILGDVLEHMSKEDAVMVWDKVKSSAKHAIISIPIIHLPQGEWDNNPFETHVKDDWSVSEVLDTFDGIKEHQVFPVVGVFLATF